MAWLKALWCTLRGHDDVLELSLERMFLRCVTCGHRSPGWRLL